METFDKDHASPEVSAKARLAKRIIVGVMIVFILLPLILAVMFGTPGF
jgi:hypothetical protein